MLRAVYHILRGTDTVYHDLGPNDFDERDRQAVIRRAMRRLETLGYRVTLEPLVPEAASYPHPPFLQGVGGDGRRLTPAWRPPRVAVP